MPFTNFLVVVEVPLGKLDEIIGNNDIHISGAKKRGEGWAVEGKSADDTVRRGNHRLRVPRRRQLQLPGV